MASLSPSHTFHLRSKRNGKQSRVDDFAGGGIPTQGKFFKLILKFLKVNILALHNVYETITKKNKEIHLIELSISDLSIHQMVTSHNLINL